METDAREAGEGRRHGANDPECHRLDWAVAVEEPPLPRDLGALGGAVAGPVDPAVISAEGERPRRDASAVEQPDTSRVVETHRSIERPHDIAAPREQQALGRTRKPQGATLPTAARARRSKRPHVDVASRALGKVGLDDGDIRRGVQKPPYHGDIVVRLSDRVMATASAKAADINDGAALSARVDDAAAVLSDDLSSAGNPTCRRAASPRPGRGDDYQDERGAEAQRCQRHPYRSARPNGRFLGQCSPFRIRST